MSNKFATILDECLERIKAGESVEACLERYPEYADELVSYLETIQVVEALRYTEPPRPEALARGREHFLAQAARLRQQPTVPVPPVPPQPTLVDRLHTLIASLTAGPAWGRAVAAVVVVLLVFATASGVVVQASETSLPGDTLYRVKQVTRQVQLITTLDPKVREIKREQILAEKREEVRAAVEKGRVFEEDIAGTITAWEEDALVLEGVRVLVTDATQIEGEPAVGRQANVRVRSEDGRLVAEQITVVAQPPVAVVQQPTLTATPTPSATPMPTQTPRPQPTKVPPTKVPPSATSTLKPKETDTPTPVPTEDLQPAEPQVIVFRGIIQTISPTLWNIDGQEVHITEETVIKGEPVVGRLARVDAFGDASGRLIATLIEVEKPKREKVYVSGPIERIEGNVIYVVGRRIRHDDRTRIDGDLAIGAFVDVEGERESPDTIFAWNIDVRPQCDLYDFVGYIEAIHPSENVWIVRGLTIHVGDASITGSPTVGALVQITACLEPDGRYIAQEIHVIPPTPTDTPTGTATPTLTATPTATATSTYTATPAEAPTSTPTVTPTPEASSLEVTPTKTVAATVTPSMPPRPTVTPSPTAGVHAQPTPEPAPTQGLATPTMAPPNDATPTATW